jgi:GNAT superfamily N-acetyltransferase
VPVTLGEITIRRMAPHDRDAVVAMLAASHGWAADDDNRSFFEWKHEHNPFGASPCWVAVSDERVVGFRTFLQWRFEHPDGRTRRAVRAVDTATAPDFQGRGIFRRLTLAAIDELRDDGIDFVFNTPNDKSRPGYLKMGWSQLGRVEIGARVAHPRAALRMLRARVPAERWSMTTGAGTPVAQLLDEHGVEHALARRQHATRMRTERSIAFLRWRYAYERLHYRAMPIGDDLAAGFVVFRIRRRGPAVEATVCDVVSSDHVPLSRVLRDVVRRAGADYAITTAGVDRSGVVLPLPRQGPILTFRPLADESIAQLHDFSLTLGDIEAL